MGEWVERKKYNGQRCDRKICEMYRLLVYDKSLPRENTGRWNNLLRDTIFHRACMHRCGFTVNYAPLSLSVLFFFCTVPPFGASAPFKRVYFSGEIMIRVDALKMYFQN